MKFETGVQYMEGKERPKKEADHFRLVGGRLKGQGNLYEPVLGAAVWIDLCNAHKNIKVYIEA